MRRDKVWSDDRAGALRTFPRFTTVIPGHHQPDSARRTLKGEAPTVSWQRLLAGSAACLHHVLRPRACLSRNGLYRPSPHWLHAANNSLHSNSVTLTATETNAVRPPSSPSDQKGAGRTLLLHYIQPREQLLKTGTVSHSRPRDQDSPGEVDKEEKNGPAELTAYSLKNSKAAPYYE